MDTIFKILHKQLDSNIKKDKQLNEQKKLFETTFKEDKITYDDSTTFSYYKNEIIYRGIMNKRAIEDAYFQGLAKMDDFYMTLDYKEKQRMMNYDIHERLKELIYFDYQGDRIYIPFFDEKMNRIYQNEMVLFDLKQYRDLVLNYAQLMIENKYGIDVYQSRFSSLVWIAQYKDEVSLFDPHTKRLFFIKDNTMVDYITVTSNSEITFLQDISSAYFYKDQKTFVSCLLDANNIDEKLAKKLNKKIDRK